MTRALLSLLCLAPLAALAADDPRVPYLEAEVRNLQRQVTSLTRRLDQLERPVAPPVRVSSPAPSVGGSKPDAWADAAKWRQVRTGMSELEVVALLGPPTSMREEGGARVLYYALEIGTSGFLGGSVRFRDRVVAEVHVPSLQ